MKIKWVIYILILSNIILLTQCVNVQDKKPLNRPQKPIVLFWSGYHQELENITHLTPHVWIEAYKTEKDTNPCLEQKALLKQNILPLLWRGAHKNNSAAEITEYWCSPAKRGFLGIAIDELGGWKSSRIEKMAKALLIAKQESPNLFIAVWHAGPLNKKWAKAYKAGADLIMLEVYSGAKSFLWFRFGFNIGVARKHDILSKSIFALGINDNDEKVKNKEARPWANTPEILKAQMEWIRKRAPEMPGIAFFAPRASIELLQTADSLAGQIFR